MNGPHRQRVHFGSVHVEPEGQQQLEGEPGEVERGEHPGEGGVRVVTGDVVRALEQREAVVDEVVVAQLGQTRAADNVDAAVPANETGKGEGEGENSSCDFGTGTYFRELGEDPRRQESQERANEVVTCTFWIHVCTCSIMNLPNGDCCGAARGSPVAGEKDSGAGAGT